MVCRAGSSDRSAATLASNRSHPSHGFGVFATMNAVAVLAAAVAVLGQNATILRAADAPDPRGPLRDAAGTVGGRHAGRGRRAAGGGRGAWPLGSSTGGGGCPRRGGADIRPGLGRDRDRGRPGATPAVARDRAARTDLAGRVGRGRVATGRVDRAGSPGERGRGGDASFTLRCRSGGAGGVPGGGGWCCARAGVRIGRDLAARRALSPDWRWPACRWW